MCNQRHLTITAYDGVALDAVAQGPASHQPLILLHGLSDSRKSFAPLMAALPETVHAIAVSQRGHGLSQKPSDPAAYRAERFADDVVAVLDAVGHARGDLLGHSMGAWAALHATLRHPSRIGGLLLIGAFSRFGGNPSVTSLGEDIAGLADPVDPAFVRAFQEAASSVDLSASFFETVVSESLRLPAGVWKSLFDAFLADDVPSDLTAIRTPTRLIWGDCDPFTGRGDQDALLNAIPSSDLHVCAGLGHSPHWDLPAMVAGQVTDFLSLQHTAA
jgi:pimeloyl-ACP methyl ester carboxylesterase